MAISAPKYLFDPKEKPSLPLHDIPVVTATDSSVEPFGCLVDDPNSVDVEIVRWPAQGWRPIDHGTGDEGGCVEGVFHGRWQGDVLYGSNEAVRGQYVLGWSVDPQLASCEKPTAPRKQVMVWHMNYHPDGGQLFYPVEKTPFVFPVAAPGDDLEPVKVIALWCDGTRGLYIHPDIWHEGIFPLADAQQFLDRQGRVHARVSCDFGQEFGVYLRVPLDGPTTRSSR